MSPSIQFLRVEPHETNPLRSSTERGNSLVSASATYLSTLCSFVWPGRLFGSRVQNALTICYAVSLIAMFLFQNIIVVQGVMLDFVGCVVLLHFFLFLFFCWLFNLGFGFA